MIIAIPVYDDNKEICVSFGRSPEFLLVDGQTKEKTYLKNPAADAPGGAGIKAAQFIVDSKADVLLTPRCGENAANVLEGAEVKIFKTETTEVEVELKKYMDGKLEMLSNFHAGFHGKQPTE
jgi:predicted Fe-Mo cluster-binding NifX family protein